MPALALSVSLAPLPAAAAPPTAPHPGWDVVNLRPDNFRPQVTGLGFLSDGTLVVAHWGGTHGNVSQRQMNGAVYFVKGALGDAPRTTVTTFASGLEDPAGLLVENDRIYLSGGNDFVELVDDDGDGRMDRRRMIYKVPGTHGRHEFLFGVLSRGGRFYVLPSSANIGLDQQVNPNRGTLLEVDPATGKAEVMAMGMRQPNGIGEGPEGEIFSVDVQGNWVPANELNHLKRGRFYGYKHTPRESWDNDKAWPPAVILHEADVASAPGNPLYIPDGPYAGQMFLGDVPTGGIRRIFLEKAAGEFQGCVFFHTHGLEAGVERLIWGPDGWLYAGGCGAEGGWAWRQNFGLQKLKPNGKAVFEMLAVRSRPGGMEIEFNDQVPAAAATPSRYAVRTWYYNSTSAYLNPPQGLQTMTPRAVQVSPEGKKVFLELPGLQANRVVHIRLADGFASQGGAPIWTRETWYTLNAFGAGKPFDPAPILASPRKPGPGGLWTRAGQGFLAVGVPSEAAHEVAVFDMLGNRKAARAGRGRAEYRFETRPWGPGLYLVEAKAAGRSQVKRILVP